ncbi:MAG: PQQ-binding-like beta-propeller repeat protein [Proteobacteria bacterium]|nr:PQQ-binding-like beta-propeller repeat protein [Pseudomonadota bacterium]
MKIKMRGLATLFVSVIASYCAWADTDIQNTRSFDNSPINSSNVANLELKWEYLTVPDTGTMNTAFGSVSSTPAVEGDYIYFNDWSGNITKLNRFTGALVWKKNYVNDLSIPNFVVNSSRNTPYISDGLVIVGSNIGLIDPLCKVVNKSPAPGVCISGDGAIVLALDANTGNVVWRQKVESHPAAKVTGSISGYDGKLFVPVGNWEEDFSRGYPDIYQNPINPNSKYPCCSARGSLVALDLKTGNKLWQTYTVIGNDPNNELQPKLKALLTPRGFFGSSTYGHNPVIDPKRKLVYIATAQTTTAPKVAEECEKKRRATGDPNANISGLPGGVTCNNLNEKLKTYANAMLAIDMKSGAVKWVYYARKYDAWNHACGAPDFYGWSSIPPIVFPVHLVNAGNCIQEPIGPDMGFGNQPMLVEDVNIPNGGKKDLVIAGNKDGRLFAIDPNNGHLVWETNVDPGSIYGGLQFGRATDGKTIYFGSTNGRNNGRKLSTPYIPVDTFLNVNGLSALGIKTGPFVKKDGATPVPYPAPSNIVLPFPGPNLVFGINDYPNSYPDPDNTGAPANFLKGPASGPVELWTLINPPSDIVADGVNVISSGNKLKTISGMVQAVDAATGKILWQRPAVDGASPTLAPTQAFGTLTVGNGVVFIGYADGQGTMVGLDAKTGKKLFQFNNKVKLSDNSLVANGGIESGPYVAGGWVYWGAGLETGAYFPSGNGVLRNGGNRLYGFKLPGCDDK